MAVINDKYKFIFFAEPHTASRTVRDGLMKLPQSRETSQYHHINLDRMIYNRYVSSDRASSYFKFATLRDPHDLITTDWIIKTAKRETLKHFMQTRHAGMQKDGTLFWRFINDIDVFIRFERLQTAVDQLMARIQAPFVMLDYKDSYKTQFKEHWRTYWMQREFDTANELFPDIRRYGYMNGVDTSELSPIVMPPI